MNSQIDLIWLAENTEKLPEWPLGETLPTRPTPKAIRALTEERLAQSQSEAWLFWHSRLDDPDPQTIQEVMRRPGNVWHAGLRLGLGGLPEIIDFLRPTWTLNLDADPSIESTSWRLSLEACLISTDVLRQMGGVSPEFTTLAGASLELGYRYLKWGVFVRHIPWMVPGQVDGGCQKLSLDDELRFAHLHFEKKQLYWMLFRTIISGYQPARQILPTWRKVSTSDQLRSYEPYQHTLNNQRLMEKEPRVTVLIPTIDRYPYLRTLLSQLRQQTIRPFEIIIVDQTPPARRDEALFEEFSDLPLTYIQQDEPGQCSSRNAGLLQSQGDFILFLDDDVEVEPNLIELHLLALCRYHAFVSSGYADEPSSGPPPPGFDYTQVSGVFPTNNTLIKREVLSKSGLFDLAYNKGQQEDGDLGIRIYLQGTFMVFSPEISVFHHHAPRGGLRTHKARVITYGKSRQSLFLRRLPHTTEVYLRKRYFLDRQNAEAYWLNIRGTFIIRGSLWRKLLKICVATIQLPDTLLKLRKRRLAAERLLERYPQIPEMRPTERP